MTERRRRERQEEFVGGGGIQPASRLFVDVLLLVTWFRSSCTWNCKKNMYRRGYGSFRFLVHAGPMGGPNAADSLEGSSGANFNRCCRRRTAGSTARSPPSLRLCPPSPPSGAFGLEGVSRRQFPSGDNDSAVRGPLMYGALSPKEDTSLKISSPCHGVH